MNSRPSVKGSNLAFLFSVFLVSFAYLENYDHVVLAYTPLTSTPRESTMSKQTVPITNFVSNDSEHLTYVNAIYGIKMQYLTKWYKHTGGYIYELLHRNY